MVVYEEWEIKTLKFWPHQTRLIKKVVDGFHQGHSAILFESPCGSGKTAVALEVIRQLVAEGSVRLCDWVAWRRNLLAQAAREADLWGLLSVNDYGTPIGGSRPLDGKLFLTSMFDSSPHQADLVVADEAQHDATASCATVRQRSQASLILGMSATPYRTDKVRLGFSLQIVDSGIHQLIREGILSSYHHYVAEKADPRYFANLWLKYREKWGITAAYFHRCEDALLFSSIIEANGIRCPTIFGGDKNRLEMLDRFCSGEFQVFANVQLLTEGFDYPELQTVFVRDASRLPTIQIAGRVLRLSPDKEFAQIVQSKRTPWPFSRTARPDRSFVLSGDRWLGIKTSDRAERVHRTTIEALSKVANTPLPDYITDKASKGRRSHSGGERWLADLDSEGRWW